MAAALEDDFRLLDRDHFDAHFRVAFGDGGDLAVDREDDFRAIDADEAEEFDVIFGFALFHAGRALALGRDEQIDAVGEWRLVLGDGGSLLGGVGRRRRGGGWFECVGWLGVFGLFRLAGRRLKSGRDERLGGRLSIRRRRDGRG